MVNSKIHNVIVVIDPGHGGDNLGADYNNVLEKDINLIVCLSLYEELVQYEGIDVYLTREEDRELSLLERAEFAEEKNADFLFCYHFNMSVSHDLFGTEVWVNSQKELYQQGTSFSQIQIESMTSLGFYNRGIKTKLNDSGTDYYGILRNCAQFNIPAVLIEHGHLDHLNDSIYFDEVEELIEIGKINATNIAKYYQLSSESLGTDYSNYNVPIVTTSDEIVAPDYSEPDLCHISMIDTNYNTGTITIYIEGNDMDSRILYFSYSLDGGEFFTELFPWPEDTYAFEYTIHIPTGETPMVQVKIDNLFDLELESNILVYEPFDYATEVATAEIGADISTMGTTEAPWVIEDTINNLGAEPDGMITFLYISCSIAIGTFISVLLLKLSKKKRTRNRYK